MCFPVTRLLMRLSPNAVYYYWRGEPGSRGRKSRAEKTAGSRRHASSSAESIAPPPALESRTAHNANTSAVSAPALSRHTSGIRLPPAPDRTWADSLYRSVPHCTRSDTGLTTSSAAASHASAQGLIPHFAQLR
jgi:hypothetical protein